jgi:hypothetical protein
MDTASESICPNNAMQLNTLVCRERPAEYEDFGSGVLEARNIGVLLVKILFVDCLPGLVMNLFSLSRITKQASCELDYEEAQIEFVFRATGEHKLMSTLLSNFYLCDILPSAFRSNEAKVKDAVKLFTLFYLTSAVWMPDSHFGLGRFGPGRFWTWLFWAWTFWNSCYVFELSRRFAENRKWFNNSMDVLEQAIK